MKIPITVLFCGLFFNMLPSPSYGYGLKKPADTLRLSLNDLWTRAATHSRAIHISDLASKIQAEEVKDAQAERLPQFSIGGNLEKATNIPVYDQGLFSKPSQHEVIHTLYKIGSDAYFNLYNGNKQTLKIKAEKLLYQISQLEKDQTLSDIRFQSASVYLDLQRNLIFRQLIKADIADQKRQLEEISAFHKNGIVLKSDVLRVKLELSRRELTLVQIENDIQIATQKLNIWIGQPDDTAIDPLEAAIPDSTEKPYESFLAQAYQHAFAYHISEEKTMLSKIRIRETKSNQRPNIGLYGTFYLANPQIFLYPYNPYLYSLGIGGIKISFPISSFYHNIHKVRASKLELEREEESHREVEDQLRQHVKEAYLNYRETLVQIEVSKTNVTRAEENARIIKNTYFHQNALITDLLDADLQVLQSRFELATAKIQAKNNYYLLQNIIGIL